MGLGVQGAGLVLLVGATALHLGFQLVVTALVYPVLLAGQEAQDDDAGRAQGRWRRAHELHRRRITPVVGPVYGLLALACAVVLLAGPPAGWRGAAALASVAAVVVVVVVTATTAGPAHGRLASRGRSEALVRRLRRADAVRLVGALVAAVAAAAAAV